MPQPRPKHHPGLIAYNRLVARVAERIMMNAEFPPLSEEQMALAWGPENPEVRGDVVVLSPREAEVARLMVIGRTCPQIGQVLKISARTVEKHREAIYKKVGVGNRAELCSWYHANTPTTVSR